MPPKTQEDENGEKYTSFRFTQSVQDRNVAQKVRMREKINRVVLDYLVQEGFQASALKLSQEAGIPLVDGGEMHQDSEAQDSARGDTNSRILSGLAPCSVGSEHDKAYVRGYGSIERRKQIKYLLLRGDVAQAINVISTHYPTVLDANNLLLFKLLRLNLIEMIRNHKTRPTAPSVGSGGAADLDSDSEKQFLNEILTFVREHLLNKVTTSMDLLRQLEVTMSLLCFDFDHHKSASQMTELPEELRNLLNLSLRNECYRAVNRVILDVDTTRPPEVGGTYVDEFGLKSAILGSHSGELPEIDDSDSSDVEISPGSDVMKSIESMISAPDFSFRRQEQEAVLETETGSELEDTSTQSKLEAIAKLWLATESILVLEKFIPEKRYFVGDDDDPRCL